MASVWPTVVWIAVALATAAGYVSGDRSSPSMPAALLVVSMTVGALALAAVALGSTPARPRPARSAIVLALCASGVVFGAARGASVAARSGIHSPRAPARDDRLIELTVVGASSTSTVCEFVGRLAPTGPRVLVSGPADRCPLSEGQIVLIPTHAFTWRDAPAMQGLREPVHKAWIRGADHRATATALWATTPPRTWFWEAIARQRHRAWEDTRANPATALVVAATLGQKHVLPPDERTALGLAGLGHLIAVSGLHVGLTAGWLAALVRRFVGVLGAPLWTALAITATALAGYVVLTGMPASAVRAASMFMVAELGALRGRPVHGVVNLAMTSALMLLARPHWLMDLGFQCSFLAMAALVLPPVPRGLLQQTWRISWVLLPLLVAQLGTDNFVALIANPLAVPVFTLWILPMGLFGWLSSSWLGAAAWRPASWGAQWILDLAHVLERVPSELALGGALVLVLVLWTRGLRPLLPACAGAVALLLAFGLPKAELRPGRLVFGSVRRVQQVVVTADARACLIDPLRPAWQWPSILAAFGATKVAGIAWTHGWAEREALEADLVEQLERRGLWQPMDTSCEPLPAVPAKALLERCAALSGAPPRVWIDENGRPSCSVRGDWQTLEVE